MIAISHGSKKFFSKDRSNKILMRREEKQKNLPSCHSKVTCSASHYMQTEQISSPPDNISSGE